MNEIWKAVEGYDGIYEVSNLGQVRSLDRYVPALCNRNGEIRNYLRRGKVLKQRKVFGGYMVVSFTVSETGTHENRFVHRLVAQAFVPGYREDLDVNHKDEDKTNNRADNLEWCSPSYNTQYGNRNTTMVEQRRRDVVMMSDDGTIIREFPSIQEAARAVGISAGHICRVCKGERNKAGGYRWKYKE